MLLASEHSLTRMGSLVRLEPCEGTLECLVRNRAVLPILSQDEVGKERKRKLVLRSWACFLSLPSLSGPSGQSLVDTLGPPRHISALDTQQMIGSPKEVFCGPSPCLNCSEIFWRQCRRDKLLSD